MITGRVTWVCEGCGAEEVTSVEYGELAFPDTFVAHGVDVRLLVESLHCRSCYDTIEAEWRKKHPDVVAIA